MAEVRQGKTIEDLKIGDSLSLTEQIEDQKILLYLGLTNDNNPLFIQHDYAQQTEYKKPLVPEILLMGLITSSISKYLPGPGSRVVNFSSNFLLPVFHGETITFTFRLMKIDERKEVVTLDVVGLNTKEERVVDATVMVEPAKKLLEEETRDARAE